MRLSGHHHFVRILTEQLDVATQRKRRNRPLSLVAPPAPRHDGRAKPEAIAQHFDAAQACHQIVAELMERDQHAERDNEGNQGMEQIHGWFINNPESKQCRRKAGFRALN